MSLRQIAEIAGVSVSTVSRVLTGADPKCASDAVKARVWAAARETGYQPNLAARQMQRGQQTPNVGHHTLGIVLGRTARTQSDGFFQALAEAVGRETVRRGEALGPLLHAQEATAISAVSDGIIVLGRCPAALLTRLNRAYRHIVCVGLNPFSDRFDQILCDGHAAATQAVSYLISKGHTRIGYVGECYAESRFTGYRATLLKRRLPVDPALVIEVQQTEGGGGRAARRLLAGGMQPTALFCANDITAIGLLRALRAAGTTPLPAVIAIDDIPQAQTLVPTLTTLHIPKEEMGAMAVKMLLDRMEGGHREPLRIEFPSRLIRRESS